MCHIVYQQLTHDLGVDFSSVMPKNAAGFGTIIDLIAFPPQNRICLMSISPRRTFRAVSWFPVLTVFLAVAMEYMKTGSGATNSVPNPSSPNPPSSMFSSPYFWLVLAAVVVAIFQTWVRYTGDWYKPDLALKYQDLLNDKLTCDARAAAAKQFQTNKKYDQKTKEVEIVLDILEDIGFYVKHDEISVEVAHHHFYHWIRGYIQTADGYIAEYRRDDPLAYEHCGFLLKAVSGFEAKKVKRDAAELHWDEEEIRDFLDEEAGMAHPD
jgi:hypothetical protein